MGQNIRDKEKAILIMSKIVSIGEKVRDRRHELKLTMFNLAVDSDCSLSVISELERGTASGMTIGTLIKIAMALEINPNELFCA